MTIWAIADLHLSFGVPNKEMDRFGEHWKNHPDKIAAHWKKLVSADDLVLIAGDISWAMHPEEAKLDLDWIASLPGTKVLIRGNHDYWWSSLSKVQKILPPSIHLIQNNVFIWNERIAVAGARLWDTRDYGFKDHIIYTPLATGIDSAPLSDKEKEAAIKEEERIYARELQRLEMSLKAIPEKASVRLAMTHYPPIGPHAIPSRASQLLSKFGVSHCVFGHLHNVNPNHPPPFGISEGVHYHLTAADYLNFVPLKIMD